MFGWSGLTLIFLDMPRRILPELLTLELLLTIFVLLLLLLLVFCVSGLSVLSLLLLDAKVSSLFNRCNPDCCSLAAILAMPK